MKMQDKLVKFNHKAPYYRMKKCAISFAAFAGIAACVAVPVSIQIINVEPVQNNAENESELNNDILTSEQQQENQEQEKEVNINEELLSY